MITASKTFFLLAALLLATPTALLATDLRFSKVFTDHCVLQREMPVPVWGWAKPDSEVHVVFADQRKSTTSNEAGKWVVKLDPMEANAKGQELKVTSGDSSISLKDVLVGEVWLASGQSNMGFTIPKSTHA